MGREGKGWATEERKAVREELEKWRMETHRETQKKKEAGKREMQGEERGVLQTGRGSLGFRAMESGEKGHVPTIRTGGNPERPM